LIKIKFFSEGFAMGEPHWLQKYIQNSNV